MEMSTDRKERARYFSSCDGGGDAIVCRREGWGGESVIGCSECMKGCGGGRTETERVAPCQAVPVWLLNTFVSLHAGFGAKKKTGKNYVIFKV